MGILNIALTILGIAGLIAGAIVVVKAAMSKETISQQKELIGTLKDGKQEQADQIKDLQDKHLESTKAIAGMQGQIDTLKTIPLQEIARDLKDVVTTQHEILKLVKS